MPDVGRTSPIYKEVFRTIPLAEENLGVSRFEIDQVVSYMSYDGGETWILECIANISRPRRIKPRLTLVKS
jgi:hypothetical protein